MYAFKICIVVSTLVLRSILYPPFLAAASMGTCMIVSTYATRSFEDVAQASGSGLRWSQMHLFRDRTVTANMIRRVEQAGYKALVITIDTPVLGKKLTDYRNKFNLPGHLKLANFNVDLVQQRSLHSWRSAGAEVYAMMDSSLTWDIITWVKSITKLPVIVKGVLTGEDALLAVQHGVDGIMVSNHGARQLDGVLATVS